MEAEELPGAPSGSASGGEDGNAVILPGSLPLSIASAQTSRASSDYWAGAERVGVDEVALAG
jgi:hypothetical protein